MLRETIMVLDTETISIEKKFCYNVGYVIADKETLEPIERKDFVIEQIWHNKPLFQSAYYSNKRQLYINRMKGKKVEMKKWGYVLKNMASDIKIFNVTSIYAQNSPFDVEVFEFNANYFETKNPIEDIPVFDILGYVHNFIAFTPKYKDFCEKNSRFTTSGNYSTTAESVYQFVSKNYDFKEEHTALNDSLIELEILKYCVKNGAKLDKVYKVYKCIPRTITKNLIIKLDNKEIFNVEYIKKSEKNGIIYLKSAK